MDRLAAQLSKFDGRSVEPFREALDWLPDTPEVLDELADLGAEPKCEVGVAWMLKERLKGGSEQPPGFAARLVELLLGCSDPIARLNLLQCMPHIELDRKLAGKLYEPLLDWIEDDWAFLRAWAYDGLGRVGQVDARRRRKIERLLDEALQSDKPSVRARIRRLRAGG